MDEYEIIYFVYKTKQNQINYSSRIIIIVAEKRYQSKHIKVEYNKTKLNKLKYIMECVHIF